MSVLNPIMALIRFIAKRPSKHFPLNDLPAVAIFEVFRLMTLQELINLALSSKRMERIVTRTRIKTAFYLILIRGEQSNIYTVNTESIILGTQKLRFVDNPKHITRKNLEPWLDENSTVLQNTANVFQRLQNVIPCKEFDLLIDLIEIEDLKIKEILEIPEFRNCQGIILNKGRIEAEDLDLIMEMAHDNRDVLIQNTEIPEDYSHEKAFKFFVMDYNDARWVRVDHLLTLKNSYKVILGNNNLSAADLNTYIKYWIQSEHDMVRMINISLKQGIQMNRKELFNGLIVLKSFRFEMSIYLVAAKSTRKKPILSFF